jgi:hypothetical protein
MTHVKQSKSKLSPAPPAPGAMRVAKPAQRILATQPEPRRYPGAVYSERVPAEVAVVIQQMNKGR